MDQLSAEPALWTIYREFRDKQAALIEEPIDSSNDGKCSDDSQHRSDDDEALDDWESETGEAVLADFQAQLAVDLESLETSSLDLDGVSQEVTFHPAHLRALTAVAMDAMARYDYDEQHLLLYMFSLMGVRDVRTAYLAGHGMILV